MLGKLFAWLVVLIIAVVFLKCDHVCNSLLSFIYMRAHVCIDE